MEKTFTQEEIAKFRSDLLFYLNKIDKHETWTRKDVDSFSDQSLSEVMQYRTAEEYAELLTM